MKGREKAEDRELKEIKKQLKQAHANLAKLSAQYRLLSKASADGKKSVKAKLSKKRS